MDESTLYDLGKELEDQLDSRSIMKQAINMISVIIAPIFMIALALYFMDPITEQLGLELTNMTEKLLFLLVIITTYSGAAISVGITQESEKIRLRQAIIMKLLKQS